MFCSYFINQYFFNYAPFVCFRSGKKQEKAMKQQEEVDSYHVQADLMSFQYKVSLCLYHIRSTIVIEKHKDIITDWIKVY